MNRNELAPFAFSAWSRPWATLKVNFTTFACGEKPRERKQFRTSPEWIFNWILSDNDSPLKPSPQIDNQCLIISSARRHWNFHFHFPAPITPTSTIARAKKTFTKHPTKHWLISYQNFLIFHPAWTAKNWIMLEWKVSSTSVEKKMIFFEGCSR